MSGLEILGIAVGILPVLLQSVDASKEGIRRLGATTLRKRKTVEKLGRALLLQQQILKETLKSVALASGCENVEDLDADPFGYFRREDVQEQIEDYLGQKNSMALVGLVEANNGTAKRLASNISGLVPMQQTPTDDLLAILDANSEHPSLLEDLVPRVKLLFAINDIKATIKDIDDGTAALARFSNLILSNRSAAQSVSSRRAAKLAAALRHVRTFADGLYRALLEGFRNTCHDNHEARLYLEDRTEIAARSLRKFGTTPTVNFDLVFTISARQGPRAFFETVMKVFDQDDNSANADMYLESSCARERRPRSRLAFLPPRNPSPSPRPGGTSVTDICAAINGSRGAECRVSFALVGNQLIGPTSKEAGSQQHDPDASVISLAQILAADGGVALPWKSRMLLALRLASCLLQLLQTRWLERAWSKAAVFFVVVNGPVAAPTPTPTPTPPGRHAQLRVELGRPFVACTFGDGDGGSGSGSGSGSGCRPAVRVDPKAALLELGILLLEIWHKMTLEARFGLGVAPTAYYDRMARALEWLDDVEEPLVELYDKAVAHCLKVNIDGDTRFLDWDDPSLWTAICGGVIEPLSKICKQWSG